jgi:hypothetical protein
VSDGAEELTLAIEADDLRTIIPALRELRSRGALLVLGNANVLVMPDELRDLATEAAFDLAPWEEPLDVFALGRALGFDVTETLDVAGSPSIVHDLHRPIPDDLRERYHCVLDAGVLFWCSDPAAALRNAFLMTRAEGLIVHSVAVSGFYGRAYYSVHPRLLEDFYLGNGCSFVAASYRPRAATPQAPPLLRKLRSRAEPRLSRNDTPGGVYLVSSGPEEVVFGRRGREFRDPATIPTNVQGVFVFRKGSHREPELPVLTEDVVAADVP